MGATPEPLIRATASDALKAVQNSGGAKRVVKPLAWNPSRHLTSRFAFGPWGNEVVGNPDTWFDNQVALGQANPGYGALDGLLARYPYLSLSTSKAKMRLISEGNGFQPTSIQQVTGATMLLQSWSPAQLFETAVDFFANRLHVNAYSDNQQAMRLTYDRDVIRKYAFGKYRDMVLAAYKHPAMVTFFTNTGSSWVAPNENLGRELLELHTVGRAAGYTQDDVVNSARMLTGRGIDNRFTDYAYSQGAHDVDPIQVMDFSHPNDDAAGGEAAGDEYISYLCNLPATATDLAREMCLRYVSDTPSDALIGAVADAYLQNDTAILPMLRTIVRSTEFWDSRGAKLRRPAENLAATIRLLRIQPVNLDLAGSLLSNWTNGLGNRPMASTLAGGYSDVASPWLSSSALLKIWQNQMTLVKGLATDTFTKPAEADLYGGQTPDTVGAAIEMMFRNLLQTAPKSAETNALLEYLGESPGLTMTKSKMRLMYADVASMLLHTAHNHLR